MVIVEQFFQLQSMGRYLLITPSLIFLPLLFQTRMVMLQGLYALQLATPTATRAAAIRLIRCSITLARSWVARCIPSVFNIAVGRAALAIMSHHSAIAVVRRLHRLLP